MNRSFRNSNIEILRIICMLFIIAGHVIMKYKNDGIGTNEYYISNILRSFFIVAVNCYVIISGYFSIKFSLSKLLKISMQVVFYSLSIYIITILLGIHTIDIKKDLLLLAPIITKRYWYITIYFVLCIISPLLNLIVEKINVNQFKVVLIVSFVIFYLVPTLCYIVNSPTITGDSGYGIINFICLYFLGRYINLYYVDRLSKKNYFLGFIIISLLLFMSNHILTIIFGFYFNSLISYDTVFVFLSSFMLFMLFKNISVHSKVINIFSQYSLTAYIIHMHPTFSDYLFNSIFNLSKYNGVAYLVAILIIPIIVYIFSWGVESIRIKVLGKLENSVIKNILDSKVFKRINVMQYD